ncbi:uncharacterized protein LOC132259213 [Phlebotomus argentipes]|uniref:uncharacterized protein LOC132259213 n=1 Tax=Phlebotomus argentipes TaxID=94469 RepID=UPI00289317AC|nr:uncharacterized protein LOC132259213 [Phlebotomus argentipes]
MVLEKSQKKTSSQGKSSVKTSKTSSSTSSTQKSSKIVSSSSAGSVRIEESSHDTPDSSLTTYIVSDEVISRKPKEHIIFGGTQITEVGSVLGKTGEDTKIVAAPGVTVTKVESGSSSSMKSSSQKASSSSYSVEIVDGKEVKRDAQSREWGSSDTQSHAEEFKSVSGTGRATETQFAAKSDSDSLKYDTGKAGQQPLFDRVMQSEERLVEQVGKEKPLDYHSQSTQYETYDPATKRIVSRAGDSQTNLSEGKITQSIDSTSLQNVLKSSSVDRLTAENVQLFNSQAKSSSKSAGKDVTVITEERRSSFDDTASGNTFIIEERGQQERQSAVTDRNQSSWDGKFVYEKPQIITSSSSFQAKDVSDSV